MDDAVRYRDFVDNNLLPIEQTTELQQHAFRRA